jgi:NitT/TauT family transport system substrate-binding protein
MKLHIRIALALLLAAGAWHRAQAADHVNVSVFQSVSDAGIYIAQDRGYFAAEGLNVTLSQLDATTMVTTALASGELDVAGGSPSAGVYNAIRQGVPIHIVADKGRMTPGHGYISLVVRQGLRDTVKQPADLKGRKLAWAAYDVGGTNAVSLDHLLRMAGLQMSDVAAQNLGFADSLAALGSGGVDAAYLIEPLVQLAAARGIGQVMLTGDRIYPNQQVAVLLYGPGFWQKRPDVATRFMVAYLRGVRDYDDAFAGKGDRAAVIAILAAHTTVKDKAMYERMAMPAIDRNGEVNLAGMQADLHWFQSAGLVKGPLEAGQIFDDRFVKAAAAKLAH